MKSGSTFTTVLNTLLNITLNFAYAAQMGLADGQFMFMVAGDDCIFACPKHLARISAFHEVALKFGQDMKVQPRNLNTAMILSSFFSPIESVETQFGSSLFKLTPEPARFCLKLGYSLSVQPDHTEWLRTTLFAASCVFQGVPGFAKIFGETPCEIVANPGLFHRDPGCAVVARSDVRFGFEERYGVSLCDVERLRFCERRCYTDAVWQLLIAYSRGAKNC
jgi:hypothetical protein